MTHPTGQPSGEAAPGQPHETAAQAPQAQATQGCGGCLWSVLAVVGISVIIGVVSIISDSGDDGPGPGSGSLAREVQAAFSNSYGWPNNSSWSHIQSFSGRDAPRVTVVTNLLDNDYGRDEAMGICRAVASVSSSVESRFTGVYVTAGEGGRFLATCDTY